MSFCFRISGSSEANSRHVSISFSCDTSAAPKTVAPSSSGHPPEESDALCALACKVIRQKEPILARPAPREQWPCCFVSQISPPIESRGLPSINDQLRFPASSYLPSLSNTALDICWEELMEALRQACVELGGCATALLRSTAPRRRVLKHPSLLKPAILVK